MSTLLYGKNNSTTVKKIVDKPISQHGKWHCLVCNKYFEEPKKKPNGKLICPECKCDCIEKVR